MSKTVNTPLHDFIASAREEIAEGNLREVVEKMRIFFQNSPILNYIIQQQGRLGNLANQVRIGTVTFEEESVIKNKIQFATLELLDKLLVYESADENIQQEIQSAIDIINTKNVLINSHVSAKKVHVGDNNIFNQFSEPIRLNDFTKGLLKQQINIFKQIMILEDDELYIPLPKQKLVKETLSFNMNIGQQEKDLSDIDIQVIFNEECFQSMLILGAPGAGKSSLLAELGYRIAVETLSQEEGLIPIFLNLTSWGTFKTKKGQSLAFGQWLRQELKASLILKGKDLEEVLLSGQVLLLLDGLDEIAEIKRKDCIFSFNEFAAEHSLPVAISCRRAEYDLIKQKTAKNHENLVLRLNGAIEIKAIGEEQMTEFLREKKYNSILNVYKQSEGLRKVLNSPLWISLAINSYIAGDWDNLPEEPENWKHLLMEYYETWILERKLTEWNIKNSKIKNRKKGTKKNLTTTYSIDNVVRWTAWLAFIMNREELSVFYLERTQPSFLPNKYLRGYEFLFHLSKSLLSGLFGIIVADISAALVISISLVLIPYLYKFLIVILPNNRRLASAISSFIPLGLGFGLIFEAFFGLVFGFFVAIPFFITATNTDTKIPKISIIEQYRFRITFYILAKGLLFGIMIGLGLALTIGITTNLSFGLVMGLATTLSVTIVTVFFFSIDENSPPPAETLIPNQGINRTRKYALWSCLVAILGFVLITTMLPASYMDLSFSNFSLRNFVEMFFIFFMSVIPELGLLGFIGHFIIRRYLIHANLVPTHYIHFLNAACRLGYLRRVGGGYRFFHREFQDELDRVYKSAFFPSLYRSRILMKGKFEK